MPSLKAIRVKHLAILTVVVPVIVAGGAPGTLVPGKMSVSLEHSVALFPAGLTALVFDMSDVCDSIRSVVGGLCIDSIHTAAGISKVTDRSQISGVSLPSEELNQVLVRVRTRELRRLVPNRQPGDSIVINPITGEVVKVYDASKSFEVYFPDSLSLDSVAKWFQAVEGVNWAQPDAYIIFD